jgi:cytochrome P450
LRSFEFRRIKDAAARREAFESCEPKIWWERSLFPMLVITDPAVGAEVMRSTDFIVPDLRVLVREIQRRQPQSLEHLQPMLELLPVFLENESHARIRKILGPFLSAKLRDIEPKLPGIIGGLLDGLPRGGEADLLSGFLVPLTREVFSILVERELTDEVMGLALGRMFDAKQTLAALSRLDQMMQRAIAFLDTKSSADDDFICRLNCIIFGIDNVMSTLAENIMVAFQASNGVTPAKLPAYPAEVMLSSTIRHAIKPTEIAGHRVEPSDLIRIHLAPFAYSTDKALNAAVFGLGRHACIGKQLSLSIWKHLVEQFNSRKLAGTVTAFESDSTHSFHVARTLKVTITPLPDREAQREVL